METKVTVTADRDGRVIVPSSRNAEYGYIRLEQTKLTVNDQGFIAQSKLSSLLKGRVDLLTTLGWKKDQTLPGKLVVIESTDRPYETAQPKRAGANGNTINHGGFPVYRDCIYDMSGSKSDTLLKSDRVAVDAIVASTEEVAEVVELN